MFQTTNQDIVAIVLFCEFKAEVLATAEAPLSSTKNNLAATSARKKFETTPVLRMRVHRHGIYKSTLGQH